MGKRDKTAVASYAMRITTVFDLLIAGAHRAQVLQFVAEDTDWGVSERTIDSYIALATKRILDLAAADREMEFGKARARLDSLYGRSFGVQDYKTALAVQKEISALHGLNAPAKQITIPWESLTEEQLTRIRDGEDPLKVAGLK